MLGVRRGNSTVWLSREAGGNGALTGGGATDSSALNTGSGATLSIIGSAGLSSTSGDGKDGVDGVTALVSEDCAAAAGGGVVKICGVGSGVGKACGGGSDSTPKQSVSAVKVFGDSLADVGTFGGVRATVQGADSLMYPERIALQYGLSKGCNFFAFDGSTFVANPTAGCRNYAIGGGRINGVASGMSAADPRRNANGERDIRP